MESEEERQRKKKEEGMVVASLHCDRAPKGSRVVCVCVCMCVDEHGKKKCVPLQGCESVYTGEGGGRAGATINSRFSLSARAHRAF